VQILTLAEIRGRIDDPALIGRMREALLAHLRGECNTPMPMHLDIEPGCEVHMKSSYRRGGDYFVLKMATTFHGKGNGMMLLVSAATGEPVAYLADSGHLTDLRTAAVSAMVARELGRLDHTIGILGSGIQAGLTARFHARVLPLKRVYLWARQPKRAERCAEEIRRIVPDVAVLSSPGAVAAATRLIITCTASRSPLLFASDIEDGTHITAVGADSPGKQELDPEILHRADTIWADSLEQCKLLGELQHAPGEWSRVVPCLSAPVPPSGLTVADLTGLGVEDLFIAESVISENIP
jgi:ornithine cyclodeaminase